MGLVLLLVIWLITLVSTYLFIAKTWWLPVGASAAAAGIDHHFTTTFILLGAVFVAAQLALGWFSWKYRGGGASSKGGGYFPRNGTLGGVLSGLSPGLFVRVKLMRRS